MTKREEYYKELLGNSNDEKDKALTAENDFIVCLPSRATALSANSLCSVRMYML